MIAKKLPPNRIKAHLIYSVWEISFDFMAILLRSSSSSKPAHLLPSGSAPVRVAVKGGLTLIPVVPSF